MRRLHVAMNAIELRARRAGPCTRAGITGMAETVFGLQTTERKDFSGREWSDLVGSNSGWDIDLCAGLAGLC